MYLELPKNSMMYWMVLLMTVWVNVSFLLENTGQSCLKLSLT